MYFWNIEKLILIYRIFWNVINIYILPRNVRNVMRIDIRNLLLNKLIYIFQKQKKQYDVWWNWLLKIWRISRVGISIFALITKQVLIMHINFSYNIIWLFSLEFYPSLFFFFFFAIHVKDFITFRIGVEKEYGRGTFNKTFTTAYRRWQVYL